MTDRLALLPLTGAGETGCEDCNSNDRFYCHPFDGSTYTDDGRFDVRLPACIQAERDAARLRAVEAAARGLHAAKEAWLDAGNRDEQESAGDRLDAAWTALRAALKETP